tara:strand:+ start:101977 stop:103017 length:1041 start_codon:yes stop_codon:yes gene_type:complete
MVFFTDFNLSKDFTIGITNLLGNITTKDHSHKGGWAKLLCCQLINEGYKNVKILDKNDKLSDFNCIVFDLGAEFSGGLNLFGGLDKKVYNRLVELDTFEGYMYSWQHKVPDLNPLQKRRANSSTCQEFIVGMSEDALTHLANTLLEVQSFDHVAFKEKILIGDSHTPSVWTPDYMIARRDGRTLKGMLEHKTVHKILTQFDSDKYDIHEAMIYCGNIDIRHHLFREERPWDMVQSYAGRILAEIPFNMSGVVSALLPIEDEVRKLPKTGYFKGTPYFGNWKERSAAVEIFNNILNANEQGITVYNHPKSFYNSAGELSFDVMERPQSVHLSPMHYRWDLDNNKARY